MTLVADQLSCERNGRLLFKNLSFTLPAGGVAELRGANGAGKSSLLRLLAGLLRAQSGTAQLNNHPLSPTDLHFIAHQEAIKPALTVAENLTFWCAMLGGGAIDTALAAFDLARLANEPAQHLSAGQRRRLALSRLFLSNRPLWLLDEPTTALDAAALRKLHHHLESHLAQGGMALLATHGDMPLASAHIIQLGQA